MIQLKKIDEDRYEALLDIKTLESYGVDSRRINEMGSFDGVDNLITEIIGKINDDFKDEIGEDCSVGILLEAALNRVVIRICKGKVDDDSFDPFGFDMDDDEHIYGIPSDEYNELENIVNEELKSITNDERDYTTGIILEFTDFEDVISICNRLKKIMTANELVTLYSEPNDEIYYLHIDKIQKLVDLFDEFEVDKEDDETIRMELEYKISEDIYNEYETLRAYSKEKGILSNKTIQYLDEYAIELMDKKVLTNITKIFK